MRSPILLTLVLAVAAQGQKALDKKLEERGASAASEAAVEKGLRWLALHQCADGRWSLHQFPKHARTAPIPKGKLTPDNSTPETNRNNDTAGTAMALLPFLAAGHTHKGKAGPYQKSVQSGLNWLVRQQAQAGADKGRLSSDMYAHCLAAMALSDAYRLTRDPALKGSAQASLNYLVAAQHDGGGWRYSPRQPGDLSVTGFVVRALHAGDKAGLAMPKKTLARAAVFVKSCEKKPGEFGYLPDSTPTTAMTAAGLRCRQLLAAVLDKEAKKGLDALKGQAALAGKNLYFGYYATQVLHEEGGEAWTAWNQGKGAAKGVRDLLVGLQDAGATKQGNAGSWRGDDIVGGRLGATSFALLSLLVYHKGDGAVEPRPEP